MTTMAQAVRAFVQSAGGKVTTGHLFRFLETGHGFVRAAGACEGLVSSLLGPAPVISDPAADVSGFCHSSSAGIDTAATRSLGKSEC